MRQDEISITHRTQQFAFGRGPDFYGVWRIKADRFELVDSAPKTPNGWFQSWATFNRLESGAETPNHPEPVTARPPFPLLAVSLLVLGIAVGVVGLFPSYLSGASLVGQTDQLVEHVLFLAAWTVAVIILALRRPAGGACAAFALGLSATVFGFYFADLGTVISSGAHVAGAGLILTLLGWALCAEGAAVAMVQTYRSDIRGRLSAPHPSLIGIAVGLSVGVVATFAPAWDSFRLYAAANGQTNIITAGNAFANPAAIIAGNVLIMIVVVIIAVLATSWRPGLVGASLLAGALVPMVAQFISALVQNSTPPSPSTFGISASQAAQAQLHISGGFTAAFYLYCAFVAGLIAFCAAQLWRTRRDAYLTPTPVAPGAPA